MLNVRLGNQVANLFYRFGAHCAIHQKRVILVSCVVITSLFYPALALYSSSNPLSDLSLRFFNAYQSDVREIWEDHDGLRIRDDAAARARCGMERTLRIERVLVRSSEWTPTGAATPSTVHFALRLDERIRNIISQAESALPCVRVHHNQCFALSPGLFFDHGIPSTPAGILGVINKTPNISVAGIPVSQTMLLSARPSEDGHYPMFEHIGFLALTYIFRDSDCLTSDGHIKWMNALEKLAPDDQGFISVAPLVFQKPRLIALQYDPTSSRPSHFSAISLFLYLSYLIIFVSFSGSLRRMDTVHSRFGLMFTGLIEIAASTVASVSVCALGGFRVTMVPWGVLPMIIVFVGAENMFLLVDAITSTPITIPVRERVGTGLAVAGTSNTLKTVVYNSILGTIAFFSSGAIQQFCSFAIVLLVAHWFLIHTFFVAVLSIDLQRLELSDMLSQDKASKPSVPSDAAPPSRRRRTMNRIQQRVRGRAAKNGSLVMMLAVTATLYYITYPFPSPPKDDTDPFLFLRHATATDRPTNIPDKVPSPAWDIWNILNPDHDHLVHIRVETPVVVVLSPNEPAGESRGHRSTKHYNYDVMARRPVRPLWLLKIVILPISTTTACLYLLLLHLLKNTELLEGQRNRPDGSPNSTAHPVLPVEDGVEFTTLPRVCATDVEFIAANEDASVLAIVSTESELFIWKGQYRQANVSDILPRGPDGPEVGSFITSVAVDSRARYCAIGTNTGTVALWQLTPQAVPCDACLLSISRKSSIRDLAFFSVDPDGTRGLSTPPPNGYYPLGKDFLVAVRENGSAMYCSLSGDLDSRDICSSHTSEVLRAYILHTSGHEGISIAFAYQDGNVELCSPGSDGREQNCVLQAGNPTDPITELHQQFVDIDGSSILILAMSTRAGIVSIWNPAQRECIFVMGDVFGDVESLRLFPTPSHPCQTCGELTPDGLSLIFSVGHTVLVHHASIPSMSKRCVCGVSSISFVRDVYSHRSRSGSASSAASSPIRPRPKISSVFASTPVGMPGFPVSGHGAYSRRTGLEKDANRRSSETLSALTSQQGDLELSSAPLSSTKNVPSRTADSTLPCLVMQQIASVNCERGSWGLIDGGKQVVGLRRRSRLAQGQSQKTTRPVSASALSAARGALTASVLERWELWTLNPAKPEAGVRTSCLLEITSPNHTAAGPSLYPRLPFTRISPLTVRSGVCVAGLGNTTGVIDFSRPSHLP